MKRLFIISALFLAFASPLHACGDKYLVRCVINREDIAAPGHELGRVVIINDGSAALERLVDLGIQNELTARGFKVYVVRTRTELTEVVADVQLDLAIVDFRKVDPFAGALTPGTRILPVVEKSFASELPALREKYAYILKAASSKSTTLTTIDLAAREDH